MAAVNLAKFDDSTHISTASASELAATLTPAGTLPLGINTTIGGKVKLLGATSGDCTIQVAAAAGTATAFTLPTSNGSANDVLVNTGSGAYSSQQIVDANVSASAAIACTKTDGNFGAMALSTNIGLSVGSAGNGAVIALLGNASNIVQLKAGSAPLGNITWPQALPSANQVLSNDGSGNTSWTDGSNIAALNATNLTSGTVPAARLPAGSLVQFKKLQTGNATIGNITTSTLTASGISLALSNSLQSSSNLVRIRIIGGLCYPTGTGMGLTIFKGATNLATALGNTPAYLREVYDSLGGNAINIEWVDAPGTTTPQTYQLYYSSYDNVHNVILNGTFAGGNEWCPIVMTLEEIAQ